VTVLDDFWRCVWRNLFDCYRWALRREPAEAIGGMVHQMVPGPRMEKVQITMSRRQEMRQHLRAFRPPRSVGPIRCFEGGRVSNKRTRKKARGKVSILRLLKRKLGFRVRPSLCLRLVRQSGGENTLIYRFTLGSS
jgi:hypothetical protein